MNSMCLLVIVLELVLSAAGEEGIIRKACGSQLVIRIENVCKNKGGLYQNGSRQRRQIIEECCKTACTDDFIAQHYCKHVVEVYELTTEESYKKHNSFLEVNADVEQFVPIAPPITLRTIANRKLSDPQVKKIPPEYYTRPVLYPFRYYVS